MAGIERHAIARATADASTMALMVVLITQRDHVLLIEPFAASAQLVGVVHLGCRSHLAGSAAVGAQRLTLQMTRTRLPPTAG
jgi:hypothetical protein